jgi:hypothetical protein
VDVAAWIIIAVTTVAAFVTSFIYFRMPGYYEKRLSASSAQKRQGDPITLWHHDKQLWNKSHAGDVPGVKACLAEGAHPNAYNLVTGGHSFHLHILFLFAFNWLFWGTLFWLSVGLCMSGWYADGVAGGIVFAVLLFVASVAPHGVKEKVLQTLPSGPAVYQGRSALHVACAKGHAYVVRALILGGATKHAKDKQSCTPALIAQRFKKPGWEKCVEILAKDLESLRMEQEEEEQREAAEKVAEQERTAAATAAAAAAADAAAAAALAVLTQSSVPLVDMVESLKNELALTGDIPAVLSAACAKLGVQSSNIGLKEQAEKCYEVLYISSPVPHTIVKAKPNEIDEDNPNMAMDLA